MSALDWDLGKQRKLKATIELTVTVTVEVWNQKEAESVMKKMESAARKEYPGAFIGCGATNVRLAEDK